jgi:hypothetical protein
MRYALMLYALTILGLAGCVAGGAPSPRQTSTTYMTLGSSAIYMTPEQSAAMITMPGDSSAVGQMRYLSGPPLNDVSGPPLGLGLGSEDRPAALKE